MFLYEKLKIKKKLKKKSISFVFILIMKMFIYLIAKYIVINHTLMELYFWYTVIILFELHKMKLNCPIKIWNNILDEPLSSKF